LKICCYKGAINKWISILFVFDSNSSKLEKSSFQRNFFSWRNF
jgi:hypothetical protein